MDKSNTALFFVPGGLKPKIQPCDGLINKLFKSNVSKLYDDHMASTDAMRNDRGYTEPPSRGLLAQWVNKAWDKVDPESIRSSWRKAGMTLALDGSKDKAWANKELNSDAQGKPLRADGDAAAAGVEAAGPSEEGETMEDLLEVLENDDDDSTGDGEGIDDPEVEVMADLRGADVVCID
ncbi:unnamed protein product [Ectocarpus sp. CCAP 1310/34]|nr:unnamed protein product [Ectocarpus sp. CCAP 1310/34]